MTNILNEYYRKARLYPAVICSLPLILLKYIVIDKYISPAYTAKFFSFIVGGVAIWAIFTYLLTQINRFVSKSLFENKNKFPTHAILMPSSIELSQNMRGKLKAMVKADFQIPLPTMTDEQNNLNETKLRIKEVVDLIINKVGKGKLLLQHNIEYGFVRNLIGGSLVACFFSLSEMFVFSFMVKSNTAFYCSLILFIFYLLPVLFSKPILNHYSKAYANILFREYVGNS